MLTDSPVLTTPLRAVILPLLVLGLTLPACAAPLRLFVAPNGDDSATGRQAKPGKNGPFATLERARDEVRKLKAEGGLPTGGVTVELRAGTYELTAPFELTAEDSGAADSPITYEGQKGKEVRLVGGKVLKDWEAVTDESVLERLEPTARGKVYQTDLRALGITDYGSPAGGGIELFFDAQPMTLARWPNEGFVKIVDVLNIEPVDVRGTKGDKGGKFVYDGDRPLRWKTEKDLWLHGYWFWDWSDQRMKVESIDTDQKVIALVPPQHGYGYRKGQWYYALNALCEIDAPGEWYLDRDTGVLYFYPPSPLGQGDAMVSVAPNLIVTREASNVTFRGLLMEGSRDHAGVMFGARGNRVEACTIRNVGGHAVAIQGADSGVVGCDIYQTAKGGISLEGGDRNTLTPGGL
ncbi:MAG: right-handed parallel beta-helix repeat-containing protein, partial [Armatimonadetes bacterium]|nr:right-handed parallel beta-helix repeat-containing protein [Armatimonadota bacterium]